jgi:hypothetical protein
MANAEWEQSLAQPTFSLSDILREIIEDAAAWDAVSRELNSEAPGDAAQWLKEVANLGDDQALFASVPELAVVLVALHNALGCAVHAPTSPFPQYAHRTVTFARSVVRQATPWHLWMQVVRIRKNKGRRAVH